MCIVTVVSISLLCYAISDMDSPFHGFFIVDLDGFNELLDYFKVNAADLNEEIKRHPKHLEVATTKSTFSADIYLDFSRDS